MDVVGILGSESLIAPADQLQARQYQWQAQRMSSDPGIDYALSLVAQPTTNAQRQASVAHDGAGRAPGRAGVSALRRGGPGALGHTAALA